SAYPHTVLVLGGPHIHFQHREVIEKDYVDFCVRGEGEYTMMELVHAVSDADNLRQVKGITFKEGNKVIVTADRPLIQNLDDLPFPARDLLPNHIYRRYVMGEEEKFTAMLASRGCPFRCHFCAVPSMWKKHRRRSVESVLDELEHVHGRYSINNVRFSDDLFVANKKWVFEFCKGIVDRGLNIKWSCDGRIGLMSTELLRRMKKAGCQYIFYGIEFGDQRILNFSGKGITIEQIYDTVKHTKEAGIIPYGYFMIGYPTETKEAIEKTISLASDPNLGLDHAGFSIVTPFPGTQLYEYCKANGLLKTTDWNQYSMIQPGKGVIKLRNVTDEELVDLYYRGHREFYFRHVREGLRQEFRDWGLL
ncbi:MAG: B12-binding domain-containing radical SAM protein, partial [Candidatus Zixiibacteriota bacterium]